MALIKAVLISQENHSETEVDGPTTYTETREFFAVVQMIHNTFNPVMYKHWYQIKPLVIFYNKNLTDTSTEQEVIHK